MRNLIVLVVSACLAAHAEAQETLHARVDALIATGAKGQPLSAPADDAEYLRRAYLDFAGRIPSMMEARAFFADKSADKRIRLIDQLLSSPEYLTFRTSVLRLVRTR